MKTFRDLRIWQEALRLTLIIYHATTGFPRAETFAMTSQIRRAAVSIPSNIAEGYSRGTRNDFHRFITIAIGSLYELQTQLLIAKAVGYLNEEKFNSIYDASRTLEAMITSFRRKIKISE